jgi:hypothetical protein
VITAMIDFELIRPLTVPAMEGRKHERQAVDRNGSQSRPGSAPAYPGLGAPLLLRSGARVLFKDALELLGREIPGREVLKKHGGWVMYSRFFDNRQPLPHHIHLFRRQGRRRRSDWNG